MKRYFAYGSNLWLEQMQRRCPGYRAVGIGFLRGFRWIISTRGYANIIKSEPDEVRGVIYEISESDECGLDECEGVHCGAYRKELMMIEAEGQCVECLVYVDPVEQEGEPKQEYIERINKGVLDSKMPVDYIDRYVRKFIPQ